MHASTYELRFNKNNVGVFFLLLHQGHSKVKLAFFSCKCLAVESTMTVRIAGATAFIHTNMPAALSPFMLHVQCKCQHSKKCIECFSIIIKIVLALQPP